MLNHPINHSNTDQIRSLFAEKIDSVSLSSEIESLRIEFLGKKGILTQSLKNLSNLPDDKRKQVGAELNQLKKEIEGSISEKKAAIEAESLEQTLQDEWLDITLPTNLFQLPKAPSLGSSHPITIIQRQIEEIFISLGFSILDGPEVETDFFNFTALNTPDDHPARDMQDTYWTEDGTLLRTHTSAIQIRGMQVHKPPFRAIGPGRVFRNETIDASHENTFYQVEGMVVDKKISVANLIFVMKLFLRSVFDKEVKVRLRPGFFPFVEPGFELDIECLICSGNGCPVCKKSGWVELLPCGLIHPNVLKHGKIDPAEFQGFAFGLGLNRLAMMLYGIDDIRWFQSGDIRFLSQFSGKKYDIFK